MIHNAFPVAFVAKDERMPMKTHVGM